MNILYSSLFKKTLSVLFGLGDTLSETRRTSAQNFTTKEATRVDTVHSPLSSVDIQTLTIGTRSAQMAQHPSTILPQYYSTSVYEWEHVNLTLASLTIYGTSSFHGVQGQFELKATATDH